MNKLRPVMHISVIGACILVSVVSIRGLMNRPEAPGTTLKSFAANPVVGNHLQISGIDWNRSKQSVVIAMNTKCAFCSASAEFYRQLTLDAKLRKVQVIGVFPNPVNEVVVYLKEKRIPIQAVGKFPLESLQISGTPTLLLVDSHGQVTRAWTGKLRPSGESEVRIAIAQINH